MTVSQRTKRFSNAPDSQQIAELRDFAEKHSAAPEYFVSKRALLVWTGGRPSRRLTGTRVRNPSRAFP